MSGRDERKSSIAARNVGQRWPLDASTHMMKPTRVAKALALAQVRGYLVLEDVPTDPTSSSETQWLLEQWNMQCEALSLHRVVVCPNVRGRWCVMIAFRAGPGSELAYVKHALAEAFSRRLGRGPSRKDSDTWAARTGKRDLAEAVASELAAIDAQQRDPAFETVVEIHAL